jgi:hypothetical protein
MTARVKPHTDTHTSYHHPLLQKYRELPVLFINLVEDAQFPLRPKMQQLFCSTEMEAKWNLTMCLPTFSEAVRFKWEDTLTIVRSVRLGNGVNNLVAGTPQPLPRHLYPSTPPCTCR